MAKEFTHRYVGNHPQEVVVGDKVLMLAPGEFVTFSKDDLKAQHNKYLFDDNQFLELSGGEKSNG